MNKKFLSAILFGALMVTSTGTFVSCKDYDEDIDGLQTQVDSNKSAIEAVKGLQTQVTALQAALTTAQSTADAAKTAAANAATAVEAAKKAAEAAAAQAKADAIAAAIKEANDLKAWVEAQGYLTKDDLAIINGQAAAVLELSAKIEAIEAGLSTLDTDIKQMYAGVQEQIELLTSTSVNNIVTLQEELALQQATLDNYEALMKELQAGDEELWAEIALARQELAGAISSLNIQLEEKTDDLWNEVALAKQELYGAISALTNIQADDKKALEEEIASVNKTLSETLSALITIQGEDKKALEEEIASVNKTLSETLSALANIQADDKKALEEEIALVNKTLSEAFSALNNSLNDKVDELWEDLTTAKGELYGAISAVNNLVNDLDGKLNTLTTLFNKRIASLTFIPESFVDGVEAIVFKSFDYYALTLKDATKADTEGEEYKNAAEATIVNPVVYAKYHVSPSTATFDELKDQLSFDVQANSEFHTSRGVASEDFAVAPEFVSLENGILTVKVNVTGLPATDEKISVVALQVKNEDGTVVTSDYATVFKKDYEDLRIVDEQKCEATPSVDYHFRRCINALDTEAGIKDVTVWADDAKSIDLEFDYKKSLDLKTVVGVHELTATKHTDTDLEALGMHVEYDIVQKYIIGANQTNQKDFVALNDGVLTAKVFDEAGAAAIGRTPIVRARLMHGENIVEVAYIKVKIVKEAAAPVNKAYALVVDDFAFACNQAGVVKTTIQQINTQLYNKIGMSKDAFHGYYTKFDDIVYEDENGIVTDLGTVAELQETVAGTTTHLLQWTLTEEQMWANAGKEITNRIYYRRSAGSLELVEIELKSKIADIKKLYDLKKVDFMSNYWNADKTYTMYNVAVPSSTTDANPANCTFINNLNASFTTWAKNSTEGIPGIMKLDPSITAINYFFCEDVEEIEEIGDIKVKFTLSADGLKLYAENVGDDRDDAPQLIATINNEGTGETPNTITYNKNSKLAKELLNTEKMYTLIGAYGEVCDDATKKVEITFEGEDHFQANFIRPISIASVANDAFIDGVDFGEKGSFIRLEDLIDPYDWRGRHFNNEDGQYSNYWGFYGPFEVEVDTKNAECNLNGVRQAVPVTVDLKQNDEPAMGTGVNAKESDYGFLTYKNNGNVVTADFEIYVKVKVNYGWGTILTDWITVPVASTVNQ